ncbi:unnamed protein product [Eretmochelys imbricata]
MYLDASRYTRGMLSFMYILYCILFIFVHLRRHTLHVLITSRPCVPVSLDFLKETFIFFKVILIKERSSVVFNKVVCVTTSLTHSLPSPSSNSPSCEIKKYAN